MNRRQMTKTVDHVRCAVPKGPTLTDQLSPVTTFYHRKNDDKTFDSICMRCYRTVTSGAEESQLAEFERDHICEDRFIRSYQS
jgi:hypothetical protein